ncbi:hypothetical protein Rsub_00862 [Raphidocelis subcapitata]|uniref:26S proteasome non-ATPase regulatory subunit 5 n=1 Tax=Raphidocelis subcapitata TaxID=307507 RepID=A0A2V0NRF7_9CHLO|nr:hypothetical protein Rsub_00862 [Raphidocelis subcapitata]|eukprot:GBF88150.1 hypothetical protein Rsub_00862 [Raphidocelis subcapitata]
MSGGDAALQRLTAAADALVASPLPLGDDGARGFLEAHPLDEVFRLLSGASLDKHAAEVISSALDKVLATPYGTSLLPAAMGYAEAALASPQPRLRRLGAAQLGRLLLPPSEAGTHANANGGSANGGSANGGSANGGGGSGGDAERSSAAAGALAGALDDPDTGVASEASRALARFASSSPARLASLLDASTPAGRALAETVGGRDATRRHRAYALLVEAAAAGGEAAAGALRQSGLLARLAGELDPSDPLSCLAALQLLQQLAEAAGPPVAALLWEQLLPRLGALLADADTAAGAMAVATRLLGQAAGGNAAAAAGGAAAAANGRGGAAAMEVDAFSGGEGAERLLRHLASILDDRGDAGPAEEVAALDAAGQLALTPGGADLLAAGPSPALLPAIASRALGRAGSAAPEVRVAALHALAAAAGGERAGAARDRGAALLPSGAGEDALRAAVFSGAVGAGWAAAPGEAVLALLQQPFADLRAALYRCVAALSLRAWFAAEVAASPALLARLCDPRAESGQMCQWRHSAVNALLATAEEVSAGAGGDEGSAPAAARRGALAGALGQLRAAAAAGPYGAAGAGGGAAAHDQHFVASRPR